jgi:haloalkane dehalogenase
MATLNRRQWLGATAALAVVPTATLLAARPSAQGSSWAAQKRRVSVRGLDMAYYEVGQGAPILFLHGNPTSSYLWRNIIPHVQHLGRCIAPDMIGMGDSDPLPDSGPGKYTFLTHREYLFEMLEALGVEDDVTLVIHDWGSAMGFTWAEQHPGRVKGIAYMEAILAPPGPPRPGPAPGSTFDTYRSPRGEQAVLQENRFVEGLIRGLEYFLTPEDAAEYRRPYLEPGESRRPTLTWPRELPLGGEPEDTYALVRAYSDWLAAETEIPKLFVRAVPGALLGRPEALEFVRGFTNQTEVTVYGPHFVQEVSPDAIGRAIAEWIPTLG